MNEATFTATTAWAAAMQDFSKEDRCEVYDAIFAYAAGDPLPEMSRAAAAAFAFARIDLDRDAAKARNRSEKSRAAVNKRWSEAKATKETKTKTPKK